MDENDRKRKRKEKKRERKRERAKERKSEREKRLRVPSFGFRVEGSGGILDSVFMVESWFRVQKPGFRVWSVRGTVGGVECRV